jgi:RNA polymerase subunit RPABC4/transcription elongation factor Spt4
LAKHWVLVVVGVVLLAAGIVAFVPGSVPSYSTVSELRVDVVVDSEHVYHKSISAKAEDKFIFNLTMNNRFVNLALWLGANEVYVQNAIDEIESEFHAPSDGVYDFTMNATQSVTVNGTVSVLRLATTITAITLYLGLALASFSVLFMTYGAYLYMQAKKEQVIECPSCKRKVPVDQSKCSYCGFDRGASTLCNHCGTAYPRSLQKCPNCGAPNR